MAQLLTIRLTRNDSSCPWGFRLQGGKDFGTPLLVQKVNGGSLSEKAGLQVGDALLQVNNVEVSEQRHKDAQDTIVRAGNNLEVVVQRGGLATWKPHVSPVGSVPSPNSYQSISPTPVTKTSLAAPNRQSPLSRPPCGFNSPSKPFAHYQVNGCHENGTSPIKAIVNKQYNSPVGIYSDESIAETLSAQAEVLAGGVLGVNFKKNEKSYNSESSEVFKMLREAEKEPRSPEPSDHTQNGVVTPSVAGLRHVSAPQTKPQSSESTLTPGKNICADCERLIVGVFVRIKEKNLHVECFKCATCGTSLKNVGYYSINNKLYCDIHAKMIAKQNPPAPNLEPVTDSPPQFGTHNKPFSPVSMNNNISTTFPSQNSCRTPNSFHNSSNLNGTNNVTSSHFNNASVRKSDTNLSTSVNILNTSCSQHVSSQQRLPFLKPRTETSAFSPVVRNTNPSRTPSDTSASALNKVGTNKTLKETVWKGADNQSEDQSNPNIGVNVQKRLSINSQEIKDVLSGSSNVALTSSHPVSPVASELEEEFSTFERHNVGPSDHRVQLIPSRPHSVRSLSPCERPMTPNQVVVFPPELPACFLKREKSLTPEIPKSPKMYVESSRKETLETIDENFTSLSTSSTANEIGTYECSEDVSFENLPKPKDQPGFIASVLTIAPDRPFTPVEPTKGFISTEPVELPPETPPYLPSNEAPNMSGLYSNTLSSLDCVSDEWDQRDPNSSSNAPQRPSLAEALAVAPTKSYNILPNNEPGESTCPNKENSDTPEAPPLSIDPSVILKKEIPKPEAIVKKEQDQFKIYPAKCGGDSFFPPIREELKAKFDQKLRTGSFSEKHKKKCYKEARKEESSTVVTETRVSQTPPIIKRPNLSSTGLHKPIELPHYQQCVQELTNRNKTPTLSRRNTPSSFARSSSQKSTPTNFEATVCTQQKTFHSALSSSLEKSVKVSESSSFFSEKKHVSEQTVSSNKISSKADEVVCQKTEKCVKTCTDNTTCEVGSRPDKSCCTKPNVADAGDSPKSPATKVQAPNKSSSPNVHSASPGTNVVTCVQPSSSPSSPVILCKSNAYSRLTKTLATLTSKSHASTSKNLSCATLKTVTSSDPNPVGGPGCGIPTSGKSAGLSVPRRGKGVWNPQNSAPGARIPLCAHCNLQIRGPFITALGKIWCPEHFLCVNQKCRRSLLDVGFVEEPTGLYCEYCFEQYLAPTCFKCGTKVKGDCLNAIGKHYHPECFTCAYCGKLFGNNPFFLEDGLPYCENDWNELFTTKCFACGFPIEAGDRWVEALNNNYHSPCFNCTMCKANLEGQSFYAKGGRPYCKSHCR